MISTYHSVLKLSVFSCCKLWGKNFTKSMFVQQNFQFGGTRNYLSLPLTFQSNWFLAKYDLKKRLPALFTPLYCLSTQEFGWENKRVCAASILVLITSKKSISRPDSSFNVEFAWAKWRQWLWAPIVCLWHSMLLFWIFLGENFGKKSQFRNLIQFCYTQIF